MLLAGPTQVRKSWFLRDLFAERKRMFNQLPDKVIWFYRIYQKLYREIPDVTFVRGLPSDFRKYIGDHSLMILDDLMTETDGDERLTSLITKESHHLN